MRVVVRFILCVSIASAAEPAPFKLATFEIEGKARLGMLLNDRMLDLAEANSYVTKKAGLHQVSFPPSMRELLEGHSGRPERKLIYRVPDPGSRSGSIIREVVDTPQTRLSDIANYLHDKKLDALPFAYSLDKVHVAAPIKYPYNLLNMAANYWTHAKEMGVNKDVNQD